MTQEQCPTPKNSPTYIPMKTQTASAVPTKPHRNKIQGILPDKKKRYLVDGQHVSEGSHPGSHLETMIFMLLLTKSTKNQKKDTPKFKYKLKVCKNLAAQNMLHKEEYDDNNHESIDETTIYPLLQNSY